MTSDKNDPDDSDLFRKTVGAVLPLKNEPRHLLKKPLSSRLSKHSAINSTRPLTINMTQERWDEHEQLEPLEMLDHSISRVFTRPGLQHRTMKQLRRGKILLADSLDLHGATALQAKQQLREFIALNIRNQSRAIIIVHGKGMRSTNKMPVLKTRVNYWLRENDNVLGFCPAAPQHGGNGALYVLLKTGKNR